MGFRRIAWLKNEIEVRRAAGGGRRRERGDGKRPFRGLRRALSGAGDPFFAGPLGWLLHGLDGLDLFPAGV